MAAGLSGRGVEELVAMGVLRSDVVHALEELEAGRASDAPCQIAAELARRICDAMKVQGEDRFMHFLMIADALVEANWLPRYLLVKGLVSDLAKDPEGCRLLQLVLEEAAGVEQAQMAAELRDHVPEALESPHANHVLQRMIELMPPSDVRFVLSELDTRWRGQPELIAKHKFGCRVLERIIEHFPACPECGHQLADFIDRMLVDAEKVWDLCKHQFGNFVIQHILEFGTREQQHAIVEALSLNNERMTEVARDAHAVGVLDKALAYPPSKEQKTLAEAVMKQDGLFGEMCVNRKGAPAGVRLVRVLPEGPMLNDALEQLKKKSEAEKCSKYQKGSKGVINVMKQIEEGSKKRSMQVILGVEYVPLLTSTRWHSPKAASLESPSTGASSSSEQVSHVELPASVPSASPQDLDSEQALCRVSPRGAGEDRRTYLSAGAAPFIPTATGSPGSWCGPSTDPWHLQEWDPAAQPWQPSIPDSWWMATVQAWPTVNST